MANILTSAVSEIKAELKPAKLLALTVVLIGLGFGLSYLSKKSALVAKVNPLVVK